MSDFALSTMWAIGQFPGLDAFFQAGRELGFARFELNHAIDSGMLQGVDLDGTIASIHEPCPADVPVRVLKERNWLISAVDEENRRLGVEAVRRSIEMACRLGSRVVIVHPGRVDLEAGLEPALLRLYRTGKRHQPEYGLAKERLAAERAAQAPANLRSVRRSLMELAEVAARAGVRLGLENRYHYDEIPLPDEVEDLLGLGCGDVVGYWHDTGHAHVLEQLGFGTHDEWLSRFSGRMLGVHLHDVVGISDHRAAGSGEVDWALVARHLPARALRTCEFQPFNSAQEVVAAVRWLKAHGCGAGRLSDE